MVKYNSSRLNTTFSALGDPTRRAILARLALGETSVTELAKPFKISLPAITKHLNVLEGAGLLKRQKSGRVCLLRLVATPMKEAARWIEQYRQFWEHQLDALGKYLNHFQPKEDAHERQ